MTISTHIWPSWYVVWPVEVEKDGHNTTFPNGNDLHVKERPSRERFVWGMWYVEEGCCEDEGKLLSEQNFVGFGKWETFFLGVRAQRISLLCGEDEGEEEP